MALTVLYDDDCGVCTALASVLARRPNLSSVAIQSDAGADLLADLDPRERLSAFHVVSPSGARRTGGAALAPLARELPGVHPLAGLLERFPAATERAYALVARNRHRLSRALGMRVCATVDRPLGSLGEAENAQVSTPMRASRGRAG